MFFFRHIYLPAAGVRRLEENQQANNIFGLRQRGICRPPKPDPFYNITMRPSTSARLVAINHQFYQTFAQPFSETRGRLQPGTLRILARLPAEAAILDLGCGNGELASALAKRGHRGPYLGLDFSPELLAEAKKTVTARRAGPGVSEPGARSAFTFLQADLTAGDWDANLPPIAFDAVLAFAVLHHLPGTELRARLLKQVRTRLSPKGTLYLSCWQFLNSPRLQARIQPWSAVGLTEEELESGDYLLDWRRGGTGLRYVHHFSPPELASLAWETGFEIAKTFSSDGEGGNLGLYQIWRPRPENEPHDGRSLPTSDQG